MSGTSNIDTGLIVNPDLGKIDTSGSTVDTGFLTPTGNFDNSTKVNTGDRGLDAKAVNTGTDLVADFSETQTGPLTMWRIGSQIPPFLDSLKIHMATGAVMDDNGKVHPDYIIGGVLNEFALSVVKKSDGNYQGYVGGGMAVVYGRLVRLPYQSTLLFDCSDYLEDKYITVYINVDLTDIDNQTADIIAATASGGFPAVQEGDNLVTHEGIARFTIGRFRYTYSSSLSSRKLDVIPTAVPIRRQSPSSGEYRRTADTVRNIDGSTRLNQKTVNSLLNAQETGFRYADRARVSTLFLPWNGKVLSYGTPIKICDTSVFDSTNWFGEKGDPFEGTDLRDIEAKRLFSITDRNLFAIRIFVDIESKKTVDKQGNATTPVWHFRVMSECGLNLSALYTEYDGYLSHVENTFRVTDSLRNGYDIMDKTDYSKAYKGFNVSTYFLAYEERDGKNATGGPFPMTANGAMTKWYARVTKDAGGNPSDQLSWEEGFLFPRHIEFFVPEPYVPNGKKRDGFVPMPTGTSTTVDTVFRYLSANAALPIVRIPLLISSDGWLCTHYYVESLGYYYNSAPASSLYPEGSLFMSGTEGDKDPTYFDIKIQPIYLC